MGRSPKQNKSLLALAVAGVCGFSQLTMAQEVPVILADADRAVKDQYIVVFNAPPSPLNIASAADMSSFAKSQADSIANEFNAQVQRYFKGGFNGAVMKMNMRQVRKMKKKYQQIAFIEQDQYVQATPIQAQGDQGSPTWGIDRVDQRDLPLDSNYHWDYDGTGVTAYVIDTGVRNSHNEFGGRSVSGWDFVDNDSDASDCNGHGTHVAGTIGGSTYGVAKNVNIVGVRVLNCSGSGTNSGVIDGVNWVASNASGPSVANMSLGGGASSALDTAVNNAVAAGVTFVVAAGNDNSNACNYSPARAASAITVGSTTSSDSRSSFSNYGSCLDIYAPGSSITSAWYNSNSSTNTISGTSMAAPHVAGVAALYLQEDSSLSPAQLDSLLSSRASNNRVSDAKSGSPNKLLYSLQGGDPGCEPNCGPSETELTSGQSVSVSGASGSEQLYFIDVPSGANSLDVNMSGGSGDADIYVNFGSTATRSNYQCRPYKNGNNESCSFNNPSAGKWSIMVHGYSSFSGANLSATVGTGGGGGNPSCSDANCLENGTPLSGLSASTGAQDFYKIVVPAGSTVSISTSGGSGDVDLYVKKGSQPTTSSYDCRPYRWGNSETCTLTNTGSTDGTYHIMLRAYNAYSGVTLEGSY